MKVVLLLATVADLALATLLAGVSGLVFGDGRQDIKGALRSAIGWPMMRLAARAAPVVDLLLEARLGVSSSVGRRVALAFDPINRY